MVLKKIANMIGTSDSPEVYRWKLWKKINGSRIHEQTILLRFLGKIYNVQYTIYNVYITNQFQATFALGGGGGGLKSVSRVTVNSKEENSEDFCPKYVQEFGLWGTTVECGVDDDKKR
jgi:hypothetical protein